jgi:hypothetical protein
MSVANIDDGRGDVIGVRLINDRGRTVRIDTNANAYIYPRTCYGRGCKRKDTEGKANHSLFHDKPLGSINRWESPHRVSCALFRRHFVSFVGALREDLVRELLLIAWH